MKQVKKLVQLVKSAWVLKNNSIETLPAQWALVPVKPNNWFKK